MEELRGPLTGASKAEFSGAPVGDKEKKKVKEQVSGEGFFRRLLGLGKKEDELIFTDKDMAVLTGISKDTAPIGESTSDKATVDKSWYSKLGSGFMKYVVYTPINFGLSLAPDSWSQPDLDKPVRKGDVDETKPVWQPYAEETKTERSLCKMLSSIFSNPLKSTPRTLESLSSKEKFSQKDREALANFLKEYMKIDTQLFGSDYRDKHGGRIFALHVTWAGDIAEKLRDPKHACRNETLRDIARGLHEFNRAMEPITNQTKDKTWSETGDFYMKVNTALVGKISPTQMTDVAGCLKEHAEAIKGAFAEVPWKHKITPRFEGSGAATTIAPSPPQPVTTGSPHRLSAVSPGATGSAAKVSMAASHAVESSQGANSSKEEIFARTLGDRIELEEGDVAASIGPLLDRMRDPQVNAGVALLETLGDVAAGGQGCWIEFAAPGNQDLKELEGLAKKQHWEKLFAKIQGPDRALTYTDDTLMTRMVEKAIADQVTETHGAIDEQAFIDGVLKKLHAEYASSAKDLKRADRGHGQAISKMETETGKVHRFDAVNEYGATNGAFMRGSPWGRVFHGPENRDLLIKCAMADACLTHAHPDGFLAEVGNALFVAFGIEDRPMKEWIPEMKRLMLSEPIGNNKYFQFIVQRQGLTDEGTIARFTELWQKFFRDLDTLVAGGPAKLQDYYDGKLPIARNRGVPGRPMGAGGAEALAFSMLAWQQSLDEVHGSSSVAMKPSEYREALAASGNPEKKTGSLIGNFLANACYRTATQLVDRDSCGCGPFGAAYVNPQHIPAVIVDAVRRAR